MIPPQKKPHEVKVSEFMAGKSRGDNAELPLVTQRDGQAFGRTRHQKSRP